METSKAREILKEVGNVYSRFGMAGVEAYSEARPSANGDKEYLRRVVVFLLEKGRETRIFGLDNNLVDEILEKVVIPRG